jgi:DUF4097 and DUF4098 domain-containing protein YvlB
LRVRGSLTGIAALALLILYCGWLGCGDNPTDSDGDGTDFTAEETFYHRYAVAAQARLTVEGVSGSVSVTGIADSDSIVVAGTRRVRSSSTQDAEAHLPSLQVEVQDLDNEVAAKTTQPSDTQGRSYEVDYEIIVPTDLKLEITNVNGTIRVEAMADSVSVENVNGGVVLEDISASTSISVTNGSIGGDVTLPLDGTIDMGVTNGNIAIGIPVNTSAQFSASVANGSISISNLLIKDKESTPTSVTGTLGDGEGTISLTVTNGGIAVVGF